MKKFNQIAMVLSLVLASNAFAETFTYMTKTSVPADVSSAVKIKDAGLGYSRITVEAESSAHALSILQVNGINVAGLEESIKLSQPELEVGEATASVVSSQALLSNDPLSSQQKNFQPRTTYVGANQLTEGIEYKRDSKRKVRVAVLDSGHVPHEDLIVAGGYSFVTLNDEDQNSDYEDVTRMDSDGDGEFDLECSSGHGVGVGSAIGATQNNGLGIFGTADVDLYMGRILATDCTAYNQPTVGQSSDLFDGLLWAIRGEQQGGVDADIINLSIAAKDVCPESIQELIDTANELGKIVTVSAGNAGENAQAYLPANCNGVIVTAANTADGGGELYSNKGDVVDISAMGEALVASKDGDYVTSTGTSLAVAYITGAIAQLKEAFPELDYESAEHILKYTASDFSADTSAYDCNIGCGEGMLDLEAAMIYAEKVLEPKVAFEHPYEESRTTCTTNDAIPVLSNFTQVCDTMFAKVTGAYFDDGVEYEYKLLRKEKAVSSWSSSEVETLKELSAYSEMSQIVIKGFDTDVYDYGVVACDGDSCPFVQDFDFTRSMLPPYCQ